MPKRIRHPLVRHSQILAASGSCKPPLHAWRVRAKSASTIAITTSTATTRPPYNFSRGWKRRCATRMFEPNSTAALMRFPATRLTKTKRSTSNCVCGKRVTGCRRCPWAHVISAVQGFLMRNIWSPAKPGDRSIFHLVWAGGISAPVAT